MGPSDKWLELLNFYLIVNSAGELTLDDFSEARLAEAYQEQPDSQDAALDAVASKLVLEFQTQRQDTELKTSPQSGDDQREAQRGQNKEIPDGLISISLP